MATIERFSRDELLELDPPERRRAVQSLLSDLLLETGADLTSPPAPEDELFLESLPATELKSLIEIELGASLPLELFFDACTIGRLTDDVVERLLDAPPVAQDVRIVPHPDVRHEPFPLTDIQQAYWLGRTETFDLGGVATHFYLELDVADLDVARLEEALQALIQRHDMLRAVITPGGRQRVLAEVPPYRIETVDMREVAPRDEGRLLDETRERMSHDVRPSDRWPLFEFRAHRLDDRRTRLHLSIDLLIMDAGSILLLFGEWLGLYMGEPPGGALELTFRDYVAATLAAEGSEGQKRARAYWLARLDDLPPAPELPVRPAACPRGARFLRRSETLDRSTWRSLKQRAHDGGLTASALLCAAYAEVLATWSKSPRFTLNVTLADRQPLHPQIGEIIGDFTSSLLLEADWSEGDFGARARRLQDQLRRDLEHRSFGGVRVQRELARSHDPARARMPVVFTSVVGAGARGLGPAGALDIEPVYGISQTPQVYLDNQVVERDGTLMVSWDAIDAFFPEGVLDDMFSAYCRMLRRIADGEHVLDEPRAPLVPAEQLRQRAQVNATTAPIGDRLLHAPVEDQVVLRPDEPAVIAPGRTLTYGELDARANRVARRLRQAGVGPGALVGVVMRKGWEQVVAVLGILRAGGAYLPIDAGLPDERVRYLLEFGRVQVALTQSNVAGPWPDGVRPLVVDDDVEWAEVDGGRLDPLQVADDLAYVIFTSGSTGLPKGVMIDHRAALNTVLDIDARFAIGPRDRVLALSSLSFDLSVWDVFGVLGAGGALVLPEPGAERDAAHWAGLVRDHGVTVWNTVPALMQLFVEHAGRRDALGDSLRLVMMSGDWIPLELPGRIRALVPDADVVSLGGATEAAIWSIFHPIHRVDPAWASIPYGRPLANQRFHVLDHALYDRPAWVPGELYIAGAGLARGYWRDPERTAEHFIDHPRTRERLYRTGDLGRYLGDGTIEFLGREDLQVKVGGHRIELGEIEVTLAEHPEVSSSAVAALGEDRGPKRLVGYFVPATGTPPSPEELRAHLADRLPAYMVPIAMVELEALPLTSNGKVDRGALPAPERAPADDRGDATPATPTEAVLARVWAEVLGIDEVGVHDDFFSLGGDSLLGLRVIAKAGEDGLRLTPRQFFENPTVAELAKAVRSGPAIAAPQEPLTGPLDLTPSQRWFFERDFAEPHHWNGMWPLMAVRDALDTDALAAALGATLVHHDVLRARFTRAADGCTAEIAGPEDAQPAPLALVDLSEVPDAELVAELETRVAEVQASLDLAEGPLVRLTYFDLGPERPARLHIAAHWLVMDYYSSRVFFEDLQTAYFQLLGGQRISLPPKTTPAQEYTEQLAEYAASDELRAELAHWRGVTAASPGPLPVDHVLGANVQGSFERIVTALEPEPTALLRELPRRFENEAREALVTAAARAVAAWTGESEVLIELEGHGREEVVEDADVSRTISRYSTLSPALVRLGDGLDAPEELPRVMDQLRAIPNRGIGYGLLRYLHADPEVRRSLAGLHPEFGLNLWGDVGEYFTDQIWPVTEAFGPHRSDAGERARVLDLMGLVAQGQLWLVWTYSRNLHRAETIEAVAERCLDELRALAAAARPAEAALR